MKKRIVFLSVFITVAILASCRSGPQVYAPPPASPEKYKNVFIDLTYDPVLLITHDEKRDAVEDLQSRLHAMGFGISTSQERSDMILRITIDDLFLADRGDRLVNRGTFGLVKDKAFMTYTATFIDNDTFDEITSKTGRLKTTKFFPSDEDIKAKFFSEMKDEILQFISESTLF